jgi:hypothetical protein
VQQLSGEREDEWMRTGWRWEEEKTRVNRGPDKIGVVDATERLSFVTKYISERRTVTAETPKKY